MNIKLGITILLITGNLFLACQNQHESLTDVQKTEIVNSAKVTVQKVFEFSNNLDFKSGLNFYSADSNSYYVSDGTILTLDELKAAYEQAGQAVEILNNSIDSWDAKILSPDLVAFTLPIHLKIKLKGLPEYTGQLVWSGIVQKREENWLIIQSHESWLNCAEVTAALSQNGTNEQ